MKKRSGGRKGESRLYTPLEDAKDCQEMVRLRGAGEGTLDSAWSFACCSDRNMLRTFGTAVMMDGERGLVGVTYEVTGMNKSGE